MSQIPVELLLSQIGKQAKVDIEAHRANLENEIEKRRQRLAELRQRRKEVGIQAGEETTGPDIAAVPPPAMEPGASLLREAGEIEDEAAEDWLLDMPPAAGGDGWEDNDWPAGESEPAGTMTMDEGPPPDEGDGNGWPAGESEPAQPEWEEDLPGGEDSLDLPEIDDLLAGGDDLFPPAGESKPAGTMDEGPPPDEGDGNGWPAGESEPAQPEWEEDLPGGEDEPLTAGTTDEGPPPDEGDGNGWPGGESEPAQPEWEEDLPGEKGGDPSPETGEETGTGPPENDGTDLNELFREAGEELNTDPFADSSLDDLFEPQTEPKKDQDLAASGPGQSDGLDDLLNEAAALDPDLLDDDWSF